MTLRLSVGGRSDVGMQRQDNQDSMYAGAQLAAVADGVGGAARGDVASRLAITALMPLDAAAISDPLQALQSAANDADTAIRETVAAHSEMSGMSTTLTALLAAGDELLLAHIGDSRAYRLRGEQLEQLTQDHTLVQALIDEGQITEEEALTHPRRSWIMRALDGRGSPEIDLTPLEVEPSDRFLVCSDGLSSYVDERDIASALAGDDPQAAADRLVNLALRAGGSDNITCIVADPVDGEQKQQQPILGGAVAEPEPPELSANAPTGATIADAPRRRHRAPGRSLGRRLAVVACVVVILVAAAVASVAVYINHQWYVAASGGKIAVYQGVHGTAAGIKLSHVHRLTNIPVTALPEDDRGNVTNRIETSGGQSGADQVVANLRSDACASVSATPAPSTTPRVIRRNGKRIVVKPSTPPTPAWCVTTP
jgi:protein phosphatase